MKTHLHIGASDTIGRVFSSLPHVLVISHHELDTLSDSRFRSVSISAFNPRRKISYVPSDNFIEKIVAKFACDIKLIYFSTARTLEIPTDERHVAYVKNKISDEINLRNYFSNLSVVYLPLLIPISIYDSNVFLEKYFANLSLGHVHFDLSAGSTWNFVHPSDLKVLIDHSNSLSDFQLLLSKRPISGHDFQKVGSQIELLSEVTFGSLTAHYPSSCDIKRIYGTFDCHDFTWLKNLYRLHKR